jgi:hypothetical protein
VTEEREEQAPNPGSPEAAKAGCTCPVFDNRNGRGYWTDGVFVIRDNCPLHGTEARDKNNQRER